MFKLLLVVHLILAVFTIGPLVAAATTAGRGIRTGDGAATASSARLLKIYGVASLLVVAVGMGLMSSTESGEKEKAGAIGQLWIWLSLVLWFIAIGIVMGLIVPTLDKATAAIGREESVVSMTGRVAAAGGVVGLLFLVIIVLMVYRPGH